MVIATALGWGTAASITISVVLAFFFGYSLTSAGSYERASPSGEQLVSRSPQTRSRSGRWSWSTTRSSSSCPVRLQLGYRTVSFEWSLLLSLAIAFVVTVPVNRWLIERSRGHAVVHGLH
jgi:hypothetical protein